MPLKEREQSYLWDMREAAHEVISCMKDVKFAQFEKNKLLRSAVERQLLIIGEAANHISPQFRKAHPQVAWPDLVALRNILCPSSERTDSALRGSLFSNFQ